MKKTLYILGSILGILLLTMIIVPVLMKDKIVQLVKEEANNMLKGELSFSDAGLSFFSDFPNATVYVSDIALVGENIFELDTLFQAQKVDIRINPFKLISSSQLQIAKVDLASPGIKLLVLDDGAVNWDIVKTKEAESETTEGAASSDMVIRLNSYSITDGNLIYEDAQSPMRVELSGLDHRGSGDMTAVTYDLDTYSQLNSMNVSYDGIRYFTNALVEADAKIKVEIDPIIKLTFNKNKATLNALPLEVDGWFAMPEKGYDMDLRFEAPEATIAGLLSMVPGVFTEDFTNMQTDGSCTISGFAKGLYLEEQLPAFGLDATARNAWLQYPDLPEKISDIGLDLHIKNPDGNLEHTEIDIRELKAEFGNNPIDAKMKLAGLTQIVIDGYAKAKLDLAALSRMVPIKSTNMAGLFELDASFKGIYDEAKEQFPAVNAWMKMENGYLKNAEYPVELSKLAFEGRLEDVDGSMKSGKLEIPRFSFLLDEEPMAGSANVSNFSDPIYSLRANGKLDLEKLMKIYPIEGTEIKGKLNIEQFETAGRMSDIEAERYDKLPTRGHLNLADFSYTGPDYPTVVIEQSDADFSPEALKFSNTKGSLGSSAFETEGSLNNYLAYALMEDESLYGNLSFRSPNLDLNEWMVAGEDVVVEDTADVPMEVIPIPANVNIDVDAQIGALKYGNMNLKEVNGDVRIADEELKLNDFSFNLQGAKIAMSGLYNTQNPRKPLYEYFLDIKNLGFKDAFSYFNVVKAFAPASRFLEGVFNSELGIKGSLRPNMLPNLEDISSLGLVEVLNGAIRKMPSMDALASFAELDKLKVWELKDVTGQFEIDDGNLILKPFTLKKDDISLKVSGKQNLAGKLQYDLVLDVPNGQIGQKAMNALSGITGGIIPTSDRLVLNLGLGGTVKAPKISLDANQTVKDQAGKVLANTLEQEIKDRTGADLPIESDSLKQQAEELKEKAVDSLKVLAEEQKKEAIDSLSNIKDSLAAEVGKEVEKRVGEEVKSQLDSLKKKFKLPKLGKKKKEN